MTSLSSSGTESTESQSQKNCMIDFESDVSLGICVRKNPVDDVRHGILVLQFPFFLKTGITINEAH